MMGPRFMRAGLLVTLMLLATPNLYSQNAGDAVRPFIGVGGPGSRANGLAQAFTAIADDYTALYYNPAGLGNLTAWEINFAQDRLNSTTSANGGWMDPVDLSATRFSNIGIVMPLPGTSITLALGYHLVRAFDYKEQLGSTVDIIDSYERRKKVEGNLGIYAVGLGYQISTKLAVGMSAELLSGISTYTEWIYSPPALSASVYDYTKIEPEYAGFAMSFGTMITPLPWWQIGLLVRTPQYVEVTEAYSALGYDDDTFHYATTGATEFRSGTSVSLGPLRLSADAKYTDYSQVRISSDLWDEVVTDSIIYKIPLDEIINEELSSDYLATLTWAVGGEMLLPIANLKIRGGYRREPYYRKSNTQSHRDIFAAGLSFVPVPQLKVDVSYNITNWTQKLSADDYFNFFVVYPLSMSVINIAVAFNFRF